MHRSHSLNNKFILLAASLNLFTIKPTNLRTYTEALKLKKKFNFPMTQDFLYKQLCITRLMVGTLNWKQIYFVFNLKYFNSIACKLIRTRLIS